MRAGDGTVPVPFPGSAAVAGSALGVSHPLTAALLVVPALELAGIVPLTPANVGIAGGAAALAFHAHGLPMHAALAAGLALHGIETGVGLLVGVLCTAALLRRRIVRSAPAVTNLSQVIHRSDAQHRTRLAEDRCG